MSYRSPDLLPMSNVQPLTTRDSYTFLEKLELLYQLNKATQLDFSDALENIAEIINTVNNRAGSPEVIHVNLAGGNVDVQFPQDLPNNHVFYVLVQQGSAGGNIVTFPDSVSGNAEIDSAPNAYSLIRLVPRGNDTWHIDESVARLRAALDAVDNKHLQHLEETLGKIDALRAEAESNLASAQQTLLGKIDADVSSARADAATALGLHEFANSESFATVNTNIDGLARTVAANMATLRAEAEALETELQASIDAMQTVINASTTASIKTLTDLVNQKSDDAFAAISVKMDKDVIINVKDYGAVGDNLTDDSDAIIAAITAAGEGQTVFFPKGRYVISKTLNMLMGQKWVGSAFNNDRASNATQSHIRSTHAGVAINCEAGTIQDMRLNGPGFDVGASVGLKIFCSSFKAINVAIRGFSNGCHLNETWYCTLNGLHLYQNAVGMTINYCYNVTLNDVRIHSDRGDGVFGRGIVLQDRSMVTIHGGSFEGFSKAIEMGSRTHVACIGTYFEAMENEVNNKAVAIQMDYGDYQSVKVIACQAYLTGLKAFVSCVWNVGGEVITALGNTFKSSSPSQYQACTVYEWAPGLHQTLQLVLLGDSFVNTINDGHKYVSDNIPPAGSLINPPRTSAPSAVHGQYSQGTLTVGGSVATMTIGAIQGGVQVPAVSSKPGMTGTGLNLRKGLLVWNETTKKLMVWTGTGWVDTAGVAQ